MHRIARTSSSVSTAVSSIYRNTDANTYLYEFIDLLIFVGIFNPD
ncbi:hypothetical protein [Lacimicrobium alkaliphilum]|nr:hypothetical protein [Lacimicrobium alkaliphilum]